jgi:hypothetical protein
MGKSKRKKLSRESKSEQQLLRVLSNWTLVTKSIATAR